VATKGRRWLASIIHVGYSTDEVFKRSALSVRFKESGLRTLGIILDADDEFDARWNRVRDFCLLYFATVPARCPDDGLALETDGKRFGAWIMPDNKSCGMIETFCKSLVPNDAATIWKHALSSVVDAKQKGAPFRDVHVEKANIYTWLAFQDPP
jgi:hypothetical protein